MRTFLATLAAALVAFLASRPTLSSEQDAPITDQQLAVMLFVDYGRSYGYQTMMARIQLDTVKAEFERDRDLLEMKEQLFREHSIPLVELEIAQLKDAWNRKQLIVAEKSLAYVSAEYEAMSQMANHFAGVEMPIGTLYATFRRGWDAGCDKGPDVAYPDGP